MDVLIIGAGVIGNAIARELSRFRIHVEVLEKEQDVGLETSCRNSGVVHSGINYAPGTLRAELNVRGNALMDDLCRDLKVKLKRIGKLTVALGKDDLPMLHKQHQQGLANGVPGMELLDRRAMEKIQPGIVGIMALWTPSSAILSPYGLTVALAENAHANGVCYHLGEEVCGVQVHSTGGFDVITRTGKHFNTKVLINAAGLSSDTVSGMVGVKGFQIWPCRGEYYVLDKRLAGSLKTLVYPVPGPNDPGLGIHLTPTVDGNILIGPSADYFSDGAREDYRSTAMVMEQLRREGQRFLSDLKVSDFIRSFAGNRPKRTPPELGGNADFIIEVRPEIPGFIHLVGIESPGLTSSPAIAQKVRDMVRSYFPLELREDFIAERPGIVGHFADLPEKMKAEFISQDPRYGEVICRCEQVTQKEVMDAIENPLGSRSLVGLKYRARVMMGRCQGGFCLPRITRILRDIYGYRPDDYFLRSDGSRLFSGNVR
ncbi:MAG: NAD(P)/FAD-dependent oxidoreductase [Synergistaceae bacterium]|nr:NAD(P)/FAD-dependent oxidoreductase [Synergistaceae bacterium]